MRSENPRLIGRVVRLVTYLPAQLLTITPILFFGVAGVETSVHEMQEGLAACDRPTVTLIPCSSHLRHIFQQHEGFNWAQLIRQ